MSDNKDKAIDKQIADLKDSIEAGGGSKDHQERNKQIIKNLEYEKESRKKK